MFIVILCWNGVEQRIQGTPVSLLSAFETKEPAPSTLVPPSQGWAPDGAPPPPLDPRLSSALPLLLLVSYLKGLIASSMAEAETSKAHTQGALGHFGAVPVPKA